MDKDELKYLFTNIFYLAIIVVVVIVLCNNRKIEYRREFVDSPILLPIPKPKLVTIPILDTIPYIDTVKVMIDYYTHKYYEEELNIAKLGKVGVKLELYNNQLQGLSYTYDIKIPMRYRNTFGIKYSLFDKDYGVYYSRNINRINLNGSIYMSGNLEVGLGYNF